VDSNEYEQKEKEFGTMITFIIGAGVWWFVTSQPSTVAMILAGFLVAYTFLAYCIMAVTMPGPDQHDLKIAAFVPIPQAEVDKQKALPRG
jgi:hypothetical protein